MYAAHGEEVGGLADSLHEQACSFASIDNFPHLSHWEQPSCWKCALRAAAE